MPEDLNFHFPINVLLQEGGLILTAAGKNAALLNPRPPANHVADDRALAGLVASLKHVSPAKFPTL